MRPFVAGLLLLTCNLCQADSARLAVTRLRCESCLDPLGVDSPNPRLTWTVESPERGARQDAYQILVASTRDKLQQNQADLWDSGRIESDDTVNIRYAGAPLASSQQAFWKVRSWDRTGKATPYSEPAAWTMGVLKPEEWQAQWIVAPWQTESLLLRRDFQVKPALRRALVHVCGLGQFELTINGHKSGAGLLAPGWSKYDRTCLYETHDVTPLIHEGANVVGLSLGDGMYHTERRNRFSKFQGSFGPQRAIAQLELEYADGGRELVVTDPTWRVHGGPVTYNDVYGGEDFDARRNPQAWDGPGFDDAGWAHAVVLVRPSGTLRGVSASAPPIAEIESKAPVATRKLSETTDVIDLGQNASYMPRITVAGPKGSVVRLTHAEIVRPDGAINRDTCGGNRGPAYWQYTKGSDEEETWFPQFFYAGCRYLQLDRFAAGPESSLPELIKLEGVVVHSTAEPVGEFACSDDLLNRIRTLVRWAQRSNMVSVLTDCPHREKLGWLEQYHLNGHAIRYEFDVERIFTKSLRDMADSQSEDGLIPNIAPEYTKFPGTFRAAAEWGASFILVPWQHYQFTGDDAPLREHYAAMQRYLDYLGTRARDHILDEGLGDWYDLGPADRPGGAQLTPPEITATAFYCRDAEVMSQIAALLGKEADADKYARLADDVRSAWRRKFVRNGGSDIGTNSQCSYALALALDLLEDADRPAALAALVKDIENRGVSITAGDVGFGPMLDALAAGGRSDVIYAILKNDAKPGYAFQLRQGETSLTEAWDANAFSSHNHFMLGQVIQWYYETVAGIRPDPAGPGFKRIIIQPTPVGDLAWAKGRYRSVRGELATSWRREGGKFKLDVTIPANATATLRLPAKNVASVTEGGGPPGKATGVKFVNMDGDRAVYALDSGSYSFESDW